MKGRKPEPAALRLIRGNPGKRRLKKAVPEPSSAGRVYCPRWLAADRYARETWAATAPELRRLGLLTRLDVQQFSLFCLAQAEIRHALDDLRAAGGRQYETNGKGGRMYRTSPAYGRLIEAIRLATALGASFGLMPSERGRLEGLPRSDRGGNPFLDHGRRPPDA